MSKNKTTIIHKYPEKDIPEAYLRAMLKERSSAGGYAVQTVENAAPALITDRMDVAVQLEAVQDLLKGYPTSHVMLTFSQLDKVVPVDLQPYDYVTDGSAVDLAFAIEGEFPSMTEDGVTEETKFSSTVILPNLAKLMKYSAGDLDKFMAELRDPTFVDMIMSRIGDRGVFCFLPPVGDPVWLGKNKLGSSYPWGQVSHTHGYVEAAATATVAKPEATKKGWWNKNKGPSVPVATTDPAPQKAQPEHPQPEGPVNLPEVPQPDTKIDAPPAAPTEVPLKTESPKGEWKRLPPGLSKKDRKHFIRRVTNCGNNLPVDWESNDFTYFEVAYAANPRTLLELKDKLVADEKKNKPQAQAGTKLSAAPTRGSEVVHEANIMVLTADEKSGVETALLKMMDRQGKAIPSPLDIQKMETKFPKFTGTFGINLAQTDEWLPEDVASFFKEHGKASFHLFLETRRAKMEAEAALAAIGDKHVKATDTHVLAHEELKPEVKKTGTGWGKWGNK